MISFGTKYWFILILAVALAAVGIVILLYFRNKANKELSKIQVRTLIVLRFLSFFIIAFLLLSPFFKTLKKIVQNPIIVTAWDNSGSMVATGDSLKEASAVNKLRTQITEKLSTDFKIVEYTFGETAGINGALNFAEKKSNYSKILSEVNNNHFNQNIGALIMAGDGIYNQGKNPLNLVSEVNFPVYTIGFGDTTVISDSRIESIRANRTAFSGNKFPVEVDVQCSKVKGEVLKLSILQNGEELESIMINPPNNNYFFTKEFFLEAGTPGLQHFSAQIQPVKNERNIKNNRSGFVINVLENKQKILFISDGSHPDIGAIKNTLEQQKTYDISVFTEEPYPSKLNDFNLIILNQLPSSGKSASKIIETAKINRLPLLFIIGNKTFLPQLNTLNQGVKIENLAGSSGEAQPLYNPAYATFNFSEEFIENIPKLPPLQAPFANYKMEPEFTPLFYQRLKGIETGKPLVATGKIDGRKIGYIFGEGIWRWRLFDYYQNQSHVRFNEFVNQLVKYLALRENEDNFIVDYKPVYTETDDVNLSAEVYNDAYEPITSEEVNIELKNTDNENYKFTFDIQGKNYALNAGHLPTGDYTFTAEVSIGNEKFTETGSFTVVPVSIENIIIRANHNMLYQLARQSGGEFFLPDQTETLINEIKTSNKLKPISYSQEMINELLNLRWMFFVVLLTMSAEWFLRKYWGIY